MSTISKQWLQQKIADMEATRDDIPFGLGEDGTNTLAALRIALASLEAEAVCVIDQSNLDYLKSGSDADVWPASRTEMGDVLLYRSATPAPVSVPAAMEMDDDFDSAFEHGKAVGWNACRAAMLQSFGNSEQLNSPVIPDGWVMVPVEPREAMINAYRDALYSDESAVSCIDLYKAMIAAAPTHSGTNDGWVSCSERMPDNRGKSHELYLCWGTYFDGDEPCCIPAWLFIHPSHGRREWEPVEDDCDPKQVVITHWMPPPAAPQQEVKP